MSDNRSGRTVTYNDTGVVDPTLPLLDDLYRIKKIVPGAGDPTGLDIPDGYARVWKNTLTGDVGLWVNDEGTLTNLTAGGGGGGGGSIGVIDSGEAALNIMAPPYNAVGDGETDDRAAIQAAIDDAYNLQIYRVWIPPKVFGIGDELHVWSEVVLIGANAGSSIKALPSFEFDGQSKAMLHGKSTAGALTNFYGPPNNSSRMHLRRIELNGNNRPDAIGILLCTQQQSTWDTVRIDNCPQYGVVLTQGQQIVVRGLEIATSGIGLYIRGHAFSWFYDLDIEQCTVKDVVIDGRAIGCSFTNTHIESLAPVAFDVQRVDSVSFDGAFYTPPPDIPSTFFKFGDQGSDTEPQGAVYTIKNARTLGSPDLVTMLEDASRGLSLHSFYDFRNYIPFLVAGNENIAALSDPDHWPGPPSAVRIIERGGVLRAL